MDKKIWQKKLSNQNKILAVNQDLQSQLVSTDFLFHFLITELLTFY